MCGKVNNNCVLQQKAWRRARNIHAQAHAECCNTADPNCQELEHDNLRSTDDIFEDIMQKCSSVSAELGLNPLKLPHVSQPPARYSGPAAVHAPISPTGHYKPQFFEMVDTVTNELKERFTGTVGLQNFIKLESILMTG